MNESLPEPLERLTHELGRLPGVGRKSALRLAFHLLKAPEGHARGLARALDDIRDRVGFCGECFNVAEGPRCAVCLDGRRDGSTICVVEEPMDVASFERGGSFRGLYHVLLGRLSPLHGVMPEDIRAAELGRRVEAAAAAGRPVGEVILATNPNIDGDATALYVARMLEPLGVATTRLGLGMSVGSSLEYVDDLTLSRALESRKSV